jgi:hypothetical protein
MLSDDAEWTRRLRDGRLFSDCSLWWKVFEQGRLNERLEDFATLVVRCTDATNVVPVLTSLGPPLAKDDRRLVRLTNAAIRETWG